MLAKWSVSIPEGAQVKVKPGHKVEKGELLLVWESGKGERVSMLSYLSHFSKEKWDEIRKEFVGKELTAGDVMLKKEKGGGGDLVSPRNGVLKGVDEFGNMEFWERADKEEVVSPADAKVLKVESGKIVLEFGAIEVKGEGIIEGKKWGVSTFTSIERDTDLTYKNKGEVVLIEKLEPHLILKSEVVGAVGIVTVGSDHDNGSDLPILKISRNDWDYLISKSGKTKNVLLNSRVGRLLIVVE